MLGIPRKLPDLEQGTDEWLELRKSHITGTALAACLGLSKWDDMASIYEEKVNGKTKPQNGAMAIGTMLEPVIRKDVNDKLAECSRLLALGKTPYQVEYETGVPEAIVTLAHGATFEPCIFTNSYNDVPLMASLDGYCFIRGKRLGLEIKTANAEDQKTAAIGGVPRHYQPQVQGQIGTADLNAVLYVSHHVATKDTRWSLVWPDEQLQEECWQGASLLWWHIQNRQPPATTKKPRKHRLIFNEQTPIGIDTRESNPLRWDHPMYRCTLKTGDYTLEGYEEIAVVEWKTIPDLWHCVGADRTRFEQQWERLAAMPFGAVCIGGTQSRILDGYEHSRVTPMAVLETLNTWSHKYRVPVWYCYNRADAAKIIKAYLFQYAKAHPLKQDTPPALLAAAEEVAL